jgi:hypothetical protein
MQGTGLRSRSFFALAAAALIAPLASPSPGPSPSAMPSPTPAVVWQGIALGEPLAGVIARIGDPESKAKSIRGTTVYGFRALDGNGTLSLTESGGDVVAIVLECDDPAALRTPVADPFGVQLGDAGERLTEIRGQPQRYDDDGGGEFTSYYGAQSQIRWTYVLRDNVVYSIGVIQPYRVVRATGAAVAVPTPRPSNAPTPPPPDGSSVDRAIRVTPEEIDADPQFELSFVRGVACGSDDRFSPTNETIFNASRKNIDRVDAVCPSTGEQRSFFFDITAVFGRANQ